MKPTIGRIVIFVPPNEPGGTIGEARRYGDRPAIVTAVHSDTCVNLVVFAAPDTDNIAEEFPSVELDDSNDPGAFSWHWPARA